MLTHSFESDINHIYEKIKSRECFSFSKYADGEYAILKNIKITNTDKWTFDPNLHQYERQKLLESFKYSHKNYYVGISCPCCQPKSNVEWMKNNVGSKNLTWANIFVNFNYNFFKEKIIPEFNNWENEVVLVANEQGKHKKLPFKVNYYCDIKIGSWLNPDLNKILENLSKHAKNKNNQLFLFSAGPLGNILAHQLHIINENNTYIDIGSTINPWIVGPNRRYLKGNSILSKTCIWD